MEPINNLPKVTIIYKGNTAQPRNFNFADVMHQSVFCDYTEVGQTSRNVAMVCKMYLVPPKLWTALTYQIN